MGILYVVATPIGNLSDMSQRAIDTLKSASLIVAEDTRHTGILLKRFEIAGKPMTSLHKYNETAKCMDIIAKLIDQDFNVALVSDAGTPCISDPGSILVDAAHKNNVKVIAIPGACAMACAVSVSGFDTAKFTFLGFLPKNKADKEEIVSLIENSEVDNFIIYESPLRIIDTLKYLANNINDLSCAVCNDISKLFESNIRGEITEIIEKLTLNPNSNKGEYVIVLHKNKIKKNTEEVEDSVSSEALILDAMIKHNLTIKDAISFLVDEKIDNKNNLYKASLKLKDFCNTSF